MEQLNKNIPSCIIIDNFYTNPDLVREFALKCNFNFHEKYHKGQRTDHCYRFPGVKERFEQLLNCKIKNWENYGTNGCFQFCTPEDKLVVHYDGQQYAGVLYLTPNAPVNCGTTLYKSKITNKMKVSNEEHNIVFKDGYLNFENFEAVDTIGNVYNRLILFDAKIIHASSGYFGNEKGNSRLFQLFFFDIHG